jgi:deoxyribodipyrimidine photo-lyase
MTKVVIIWFRDDLRLQDHPALYHGALYAQQNAYHILPIYIYEGSIGEAARWWLCQSLTSLSDSMSGFLNTYQGDAATVITELMTRFDVQKVVWNRRYTSQGRLIDDQVMTVLNDDHVPYETYPGTVLIEPNHILKSDGSYYRVFTPFYKSSYLGKDFGHPLPSPFSHPMSLDLYTKDLSSQPLNIVPTHPWHQKLHHYWNPGESSAHHQWQTFIKQGLDGYKEGRNVPALPHVSKLSPYLRFGNISPRIIWNDLGNRDAPCEDINHFKSELGWREFSIYLLYHYPDLPNTNFNRSFDRFPWRFDQELYTAWKTGQTGIPIVDAGMRELWETGYMHNRLRMIVGSFLVKNLGIHWTYGRDFFDDCLVDADIANNNAGWQWIAGSGADAAPYFRIFNPLLQSQKFDPKGTYIKHYVPELKNASLNFLHDPYHDVAPHHYPSPIVDLSKSRTAALEAYKTLS